MIIALLQIIYITDEGSLTCKRMLEYACAALVHSVYVGVIGLHGEGWQPKIRPCWVWRKVSSVYNGVME